MLSRNGVNRYIWQKLLHIQPKLELADVKPCEKDGLPALSFRLRANDPAERQAKVEILAEPDRVIGSGTARVGAETILPLPEAAVSARPTRYFARLTPPDGKSFRVALPGNPVPVGIPYCANAVNLPVGSGLRAAFIRLKPGHTAVMRSKARWIVRRAGFTLHPMRITFILRAM